MKGASEGAGLGNKFLAHIRESDAICQVIRAFTDHDVVHVDGRVSPEEDIETINTELILADLQTLDKAIPRLQKEARIDKERVAVARGRREGAARCSTGQTVFAAGLDRGSAAGAVPADRQAVPLRDQRRRGRARRRGVQVAHARRWSPPPRRSSSTPRSRPSSSSSPRTRRSSSCSRSGRTESGLTQLARVGFDTLGLQTYLTAGPKEARAWTIPKGATAPEAAGVIHTDFQKGFIKAEVVSFDDLVAAGSMAEAKAKGKVRIEGKDYVMGDGDVVEFRFNV